jgi:Carboxypeptidase regulatory-like domain
MGSLLLFALIQLSQAEDHCGSIHGIVNNSEGAPMVDTPVAVTNQSTDAVFRVLTNSDGSYQFPKLPAGIYTLAIQATGFQTTTIYGIKLDINMEFTGKIEMLTGKMTSAVLLPADAVTKSRCAHQKSQVASKTQSSSGGTSPATSPTASAPH